MYLVKHDGTEYYYCSFECLRVDWPSDVPYKIIEGWHVPCDATMCETNQEITQ